MIYTRTNLTIGINSQRGLGGNVDRSKTKQVLFFPTKNPSKYRNATLKAEKREEYYPCSALANNSGISLHECESNGRSFIFTIYSS
jgi:hypothetical protein